MYEARASVALRELRRAPGPTDTGARGHPLQALAIQPPPPRSLPRRAWGVSAAADPVSGTFPRAHVCCARPSALWRLGTRKHVWRWQVQTRCWAVWALRLWPPPVSGMHEAAAERALLQGGQLATLTQLVGDWGGQPRPSGDATRPGLSYARYGLTPK